jgi:poly-gamma-glutamate synthesis protein (capsule biosynthesis protein)
VKIALTGDVMLGRLVDQYVIQNQSVRPEALWGDVMPLLLSADCRLINLECIVSSQGAKWRPDMKAFHFRAHPRALEFLRAARIEGVTLANNHVLDYGPDALVECLTLLDAAKIQRAGAGTTLDEALAPALFSLPQGSVAVMALTDNEPEWEASQTQPGVNYVSYDEEGLLEPYRSRIALALIRARRRADLVIVSAHVGPNWGDPTLAMQTLAHELVDMGADLYWGHSNHTPQGVELYKGRAILYSTGDFVDDYMIDKHERNDLSFLFMLEVEQNRISRIVLHPTTIQHMAVRRANEHERRFLTDTMQTKCNAFRTVMVMDGPQGTITLR